MSIPSSERRLIAQVAAESSWANTENRSARTAPARAARDAKFLDEAGGDPVRAAHLRKAHFARLSLKSVQSRRKSRELTSLAEQAEAELADLGGGDGEPPGGPVAPSIRREHESRGGGSATPESLTRDAHRLLDACGVARSPKWVQRVVRDYCSASASGLPFGMYLTNRVELNAQQRQAILDRSDLRYLLEYADPTGETATRNVLREKSTDRGVQPRDEPHKRSGPRHRSRSRSRRHQAARLHPV